MTAGGATAIFTRRVAAVMDSAPPVLAQAVPLAEAVAAMRSKRASCLLAVDAKGALAGILTEQDVARRATYRLGPDAPIAAAMSSPVHTLHGDDYLYRAVGQMRRLGHRHMPVVDANGQPLGMVTLDSALLAASARLLSGVDSLTQDSTEPGLAAAKRAQADFAWDLMEGGVDPLEIMAVLSEINRDLHRRVLLNALAAVGENPPVPFSLLIMGSGGRRESFLRPDQDNGFIIADYPDDAHTEIDAWFADLAERFTASLDRIGFPLCKGSVMATNPVWRKTASQWHEQVAIWAARRSPVAVLNADIFLDFDCVWGPSEPVSELRATVLREIGRNSGFLGAMALEEERLSVALGWFGRVATERGGEHAGRADLKLHGLMPLVAAVRRYALRHGVTATGTLDRIAALAGAGVFLRDEADRLAHAFTHLAGLLLHQQLTDVRKGGEPGNHVEPAALTAFDRERLVESLRAAELVARRARADFTGRMV